MRKLTCRIKLLFFVWVGCRFTHTDWHLVDCGLIAVLGFGLFVCLLLVLLWLNLIDLLM